MGGKAALGLEIHDAKKRLEIGEGAVRLLAGAAEHIVSLRGLDRDRLAPIGRCVPIV
jgi:hypothetical protein